MSENASIAREKRGASGRYVIRCVDGGEAELSYARLGAVIRADHTYTPPAHRGKGLAARLVEALVADARAEGLVVDPRCAYVRTWFARHPEHADLRAP